MSEERKPLVFGYIRVSTVDQANQGMSMEAQNATVDGFFKGVLESQGLGWGGMIRDPAQSAGTPLLERKGGMVLAKTLKKGDHIVFAKVDRAFRSTIDCCRTLTLWREQGITAHMLDVGLNTSTEMGWAMITILALFAEMELRRRRERFMAANAIRKANGEVLTRVEAGYRRDKSRTGNRGWGHKVLWPEDPARYHRRLFYSLHLQGMTDRQVWLWQIQALRAHKFRFPNMKRIDKDGCINSYSIAGVTLAIFKERRYLRRHPELEAEYADPKAATEKVIYLLTRTKANRDAVKVRKYKAKKKAEAAAAKAQIDPSLSTE